MHIYLVFFLEPVVLDRARHFGQAAPALLGVDDIHRPNDSRRSVDRHGGRGLREVNTPKQDLPIRQ